MSEFPLVSVVVLNHNKKEKSIQCLQSVFQLEWPNLEVLFVDNASEDDSAAAVRIAFAEQVRVIDRDQNNVVAGRNEGFLQSQGEFVLSLDNDMILPDVDLIRKALPLFLRFPEVGILTPKIASPEDPADFQTEHWWHPFPIEKSEGAFFFTSYFPEAAVFFRKTALEEVGGYDPDFFMGFEQADLAIRFIRKGWKILYCPSLSCIEDDVRSVFVNRRHPIHYLNLRNKLWTGWKHFPFFKALSFGSGRSAIALIRSIRYGYPDLVWKAIFQGIFPPKKIRLKRNPMNSLEWRRFEEVKKGRLVEIEEESPGVDASARV